MGVKTPPSYPIASVDSALRLVLLFRDGGPIRVADAARELGVGRSTAHRLLAMLQYHEFVRQDPETKAYDAGPALVAVGLGVVRRMDVRRELRPHLDALRRATGETAHLVVLEGAECMFVDCVETDVPLRVASRVGMRLPAHCSAAGKALLADLDAVELRQRYPAGRLPQLTPRSVATRAALEAELEDVRRRGYATNFGGSQIDVGAVAVAVRPGDGPARAALSVSAPLSRVAEADVPRLVPIMLDVAARAGADVAAAS